MAPSNKERRLWTPVQLMPSAQPKDGVAGTAPLNKNNLCAAQVLHKRAPSDLIEG